MAKPKYSSELKIFIAQDYFPGRTSYRESEARCRADPQTALTWAKNTNRWVQ